MWRLVRRVRPGPGHVWTPRARGCLAGADWISTLELRQLQYEKSMSVTRILISNASLIRVLGPDGRTLNKVLSFQIISCFHTSDL